MENILDVSNTIAITLAILGQAMHFLPLPLNIFRSPQTLVLIHIHVVVLSR